MIEVKDLEKNFTKVRALDNVSFTAKQGEVYGLVGPNGAGKTTCLNIVATLLEPCGGSVYIDGQDISRFVLESRQKIGYMPDFFGTYRNVTFYDYLDFFAGCYGLPLKRRKTRIDYVAELTGLADKKQEMVDNLSRGMKQRLCLAKTLLHEPKVLLLDEPASGLDPYARIEIRRILKTVSGAGTTILISSHILSDLQNLCTNIAVMSKGRIVDQGRLDEILRRAIPSRKWRLGVSDNHEAAGKVLKGLSFASDVIHDRKEGITLAINELAVKNEGLSHEEISSGILKALMDSNFIVTNFTEVKADLEDAYINITGADIHPD